MIDLDPIRAIADRVEIVGDAILIQADCVAVLPLLPKVDAVVTDIPYGEVNRLTNGLRDLDKGVADIADFDIVALAGSLASKGRSIYVWCGIEQVSALRHAFVSEGLSTRVCVWEKNNPSPMNGQFLWLSSIELCVFGKEAGAPYFGHCASPVWRFATERDQLHRTQKPIPLMERQISASIPVGGVALDPFMGSASTGVAAIQLGRKFIGIEREAKYFDIAVKRITDATRQGDLFIAKTPVAKPVQEVML